MSNKKSSVLISGLALFSMFFGAGNMVFPLILGHETGDQVGYAILGFSITGIIFPLTGLLAIMLYNGDYRAFFSRIGPRVGFALLFIVQFVNGPVGAIPRLITLSHSTVAHYIPWMSLPLFSLLCAGLMFSCAYRQHRVITLLGYVLTPLLLGSLALIVVMGLSSHPAPMPVIEAPAATFWHGLTTGYNTLDLIASFFFAHMVMNHFIRETEEMDPKEQRKETMRRFMKASLIAAGLLGAVYAGLCLISSYYTPYLHGVTSPEQLITAISYTILGPYGGIVASIAVAMACLTTAISLTSISGEFIQKDLLQDRTGPALPLWTALGISALLANLGFVGIASMLSPILQVACPALFVLSLLNIAHKLYQFKPVKIPVYTTLLAAVAMIVLH